MSNRHEEWPCGCEYLNDEHIKVCVDHRDWNQKLSDKMGTDNHAREEILFGAARVFIASGQYDVARILQGMVTHATPEIYVEQQRLHRMERMESDNRALVEELAAAKAKIAELGSVYDDVTAVGKERDEFEFKYQTLARELEAAKADLAESDRLNVECCEAINRSLETERQRADAAERERDARIEELATQNAALRDRLKGEHLAWLAKKEYEDAIAQRDRRIAATLPMLESLHRGYWASNEERDALIDGAYEALTGVPASPAPSKSVAKRHAIMREAREEAISETATKCNAMATRSRDLARVECSLESEHAGEHVATCGYWWSTHVSGANENGGSLDSHSKEPK